MRKGCTRDAETIRFMIEAVRDGDSPGGSWSLIGFA
jgi:hypothetical protein